MISFEFRKTQNGSMFNIMKYNNYSKRETIIRNNWVFIQFIYFYLLYRYCIFDEILTNIEIKKRI